MSETEALSQGTRDVCNRCGEPAGTFRFCLNCGASVDDQLGPAGASETARPSRIRRVLRRIARWRTPIVVFPLLAALAIVGGMGAQMLTAKIPPPDTHAEVTCWDGARARSADACTAPSRMEGLRWVFPTFHPNRDDCVDVLLTHPEYLRPAMYECDFKVLRHWVKVTYMELAAVDAARIYFEKYFAQSSREQVRTAEGTPYRYVWRQHTDQGYELASMYIDFPYAVSITAPAAVYRDRALREVEFRHPDKISVADPPSD